MLSAEAGVEEERLAVLSRLHCASAASTFLLSAAFHLAVACLGLLSLRQV